MASESERPHSEERPVIEQQSSEPITTAESISTDNDDEETLQRTQTSATVRERRFEEIRSGDREELSRIATNLARTQSGKYSVADEKDLQRKDTLYGVNIGDSVLDPTSPDFDVYKWARM